LFRIREPEDVMMMILRRTLVILATLVSAVTGPVTAATAEPATLAAAPCAIDSTSTVVHADWLLVHTKPSSTSPSVGQLKGGAAVHFCSSYFVNFSGQWAWTYGYGYNGSTKVTGYMYDRYLAGPWQ
jgi:uncharacterized protein YgiM (DUF1202 family)